MEALEWLGRVLAAVVDVWGLSAPGHTAGEAPATVPVAVGVALLAGLSMMLGHAVVFSINRVGGWRLATGLALGALYVLVLRGLTAVAVAGVVWAVTGGEVPGRTVGIAFLLAVAPHVLGFFVFVPHLGIGFGRVLEIWSLVALVVLLADVMGTAGWLSLAIGLGAWLGARLLSRLLARPVAVGASRVWTAVTGRPTFFTGHDLLTGVPFVPLEVGERAR
jgi:hypothetical protein